MTKSYYELIGMIEQFLHHFDTKPGPPLPPPPDQERQDKHRQVMSERILKQWLREKGGAVIAATRPLLERGEQVVLLESAVAAARVGMTRIPGVTAAHSPAGPPTQPERPGALTRADLERLIVERNADAMIKEATKLDKAVKAFVTDFSEETKNESGKLHKKVDEFRDVLAAIGQHYPHLDPGLRALFNELAEQLSGGGDVGDSSYAKKLVSSSSNSGS